jgi:hypothetical protein
VSLVQGLESHLQVFKFPFLIDVYFFQVHYFLVLLSKGELQLQMEGVCLMRASGAPWTASAMLVPCIVQYLTENQLYAMQRTYAPNPPSIGGAGDLAYMP